MRLQWLNSSRSSSSSSRSSSSTTVVAVEFGHPQNLTHSNKILYKVFVAKSFFLRFKSCVCCRVVAC